jgi:uncharacterized repeat protein (TIGR02543 family)
MLNEAPSVVNLPSLDNIVTAPVTGTAPNTMPIETVQYTGTVTWKTENGEPLTGNLFMASTVYKALVTLTAKSGWTFVGASANFFTYSGAVLVTNSASSGTVTVTITFPATEALFIVIYNANEGTGAAPGPQTAAPGQSVILADGSALSRTGYLLAGWNTSADGAETTYPAGMPFTPTQDTILYARWTHLTYTITYRGNGHSGGAEPSNQTKTYGTNLLLADAGTLVKSGYTFEEWNTASDGSGTGYAAGLLLTSDLSATAGDTVILYARWIPQYTITYRGNGHSGGDEPSNQTKTYGTNLLLADAGTLVKAGYVFKGWNTESDGSGTSYTAGSLLTTDLSATAGDTVILYARWVLQYTITYSGNGHSGGIEPSSQTKTYGTDLLLPGAGTLVRVGYTFGGWNTESDGSGITYTAGLVLSGDLSNTAGGTVPLYALWTAITYSIVYIGNGHSGGAVPSSQTKTYGTNLPLPDTGTLVKAGYTLKGWNTASNGSGESYAAGSLLTSDLSATAWAIVILYAEWHKDSGISITFGGGAEEETIGWNGSPAASIRWTTGESLSAVVNTAVGQWAGGADSFTWYKDGALIEDETSSAITINAQSLSLGQHILTVEVTRGSGGSAVSYSKTLWFMVVE